DRIRSLRVVPILLVVDRDSIPAGAGWIIEMVQGRGLAVQRDGLKQQLIVGSPRDLDNQVIPCIVERITRNPSFHPMLLDVVPNVPFVSTSDSALMSPDK